MSGLRPVLAALVGLALAIGATALAGENPGHVLTVLFTGAFGSAYDLGMTLFYATPLIFTGLAVSLPIQAGLFNIGAEGQLTMGALAATLVALAAPNLAPAPAVLVASLAAFGGGALWGSLPGWLKARRGSHEVITTIMMNFIAAGLASWVVLHLIRSTESQNPESAPLAPAYRLAPFPVFDGAPVGWALVLALGLALGVWLLLSATSRGFELRAVGQNQEAAQTAAIDVARVQVGAMALAGGVAGLVGVAEVLGSAGRLRLGFSPDYGFIGIPVALLARGHPLGVILSALLFGALQKGASELELETDHVTRDLASLMQAMVVLCVSVEGGFRLWRRRAPRGAVDRPAGAGTSGEGGS